MGRVLRSHRAMIDIADIGEYIAAHNESAARRMLERLDALFVQLSISPDMGQRRDDLVPGRKAIYRWQLCRCVPRRDRRC